MTDDSERPLVFIVDDDDGVRTALARLLRASGLQVETFESSEAFLARELPSVPSCLVLDVALPGLDGLSLQRQLVGRGHAPPIVFLSGRGDIPMSVRTMKDGAVDFLSKPTADDVLLEAVRTAIARDRAARAVTAARAEVDLRAATLTSREREVMRHVIAGKRNKKIAVDLGIAEKTIKVHRGRIMAKMRAGSVAELVRLAEAVGVAPAP